MKRTFFLFLTIFLFIVSIQTSVLCQWNYYIRDHLGSTRVVLDENGNVKEYYDYEPFGLSIRENITGSENARYKFTGKELDDRNSLNWYDFGARYYDPNIGRWLSPDPLAEKYPGLSPYVYAADNPIIYFDPNGKEVRGVGRSVTGGLLFGYTKGKMAVYDDRGNVGFISYSGKGAYIGASIGLNIDALYAPKVETIFDLAGSGEAWGGSWTDPVGLSVEGIMSGHYPEKQSPEGITGSFSIGGGILPAEVHSFITKTTLYSFSKSETNNLTEFALSGGGFSVSKEGKLIIHHPQLGKQATDIIMVRLNKNTWISQKALEERDEEQNQ